MQNLAAAFAFNTSILQCYLAKQSPPFCRRQSIQLLISSRLQSLNLQTAKDALLNAYLQYRDQMPLASHLQIDVD